MYRFLQGLSNDSPLPSTAPNIIPPTHTELQYTTNGPQQTPLDPQQTANGHLKYSLQPRLPLTGSPQPT